MCTNGGRGVQDKYPKTKNNNITLSFETVKMKNIHESEYINHDPS